MYKVLYHPDVVRDDIPSFDETTKRRVRSAIEQKLTTAPEIFGKPLRRSLKGYRKLRVGDYRIVFRITGHAVYVLAILHRSFVYEQSQRRI